jgi:hypothetical protein
MAYVQGLSGPLSHLNGAVCEPRLLPTGQVVADVKHKSGTIQFAGKAKFFAPFQKKAKRRVSAEPFPPEWYGPTGGAIFTAIQPGLLCCAYTTTSAPSSNCRGP